MFRHRSYLPPLLCCVASICSVDLALNGGNSVNYDIMIVYECRRTVGQPNRSMMGDVCFLADDQISFTRKMATSNIENSGKQVNGFNYVWQQMVGAQAKTSESKPDLRF